jgi:hypothetical protein
MLEALGTDTVPVAVNVQPITPNASIATCRNNNSRSNSSGESSLWHWASVQRKHRVCIQHTMTNHWDRAERLALVTSIIAQGVCCSAAVPCDTPLLACCTGSHV